VPRTLVVVAAVALPAVALASGSPAAPRAGSWKLVPSGAERGLISGKLVVSSAKTVTGIHGKVAKSSECAGGAMVVKGKFKLKLVTFVGGIRQWSVGSGRNYAGGLASTPIDLTIAGAKEPDANITIAFPTKGEAGVQLEARLNAYRYTRAAS
jgi:hypothetical protein